MREGGGGRRALSLFRFHLSSFPPETPDTEDKNTGTCLSYNAINLPGTGNIFLSAQNGKRTVIGVFEGWEGGWGGGVSNKDNEFL